MNLKRVNIELDVSEVREILAIDVDEDAQRALSTCPQDKVDKMRCRSFRVIPAIF